MMDAGTLAKLLLCLPPETQVMVRTDGDMKPLEVSIVTILHGDAACAEIWLEGER